MKDPWPEVETHMFQAGPLPALVVAPLVPGMSWQRRAWPALLVLVLALALVLGGIFDWLRLEVLQREYVQLLAWAGQRPWLTGAALTIALTLLVSSGLPGGVVLLIAGGALFGTVPGALIGVFANTVGGTILYATTRRLLLGGAGPAPPWVDRLRATFDRAPASFALFLRLAPVFPYGAASIALAWLGCRSPLFVVTSAIGILPAVFVYAALGSALSLLLASGAPIDAGALRQPQVWAPLAALGVLALLAALLGSLRGRTRN